ncbi:autotransporter [Bartonella henselae]|uniref:autotransporter outer membrane beta-barrel domain-containing protein n=3 Tax=Bartonella TaxID=773 RepID=UPI00095FD6A0|nr:autotransporter outer membrane beta-barrel domain-containing protein [Bartonella henselae]OLL47104.1 autotransporter [Bartonella henselae]OLL51694.1 autotransporter [Bartonella henselae]OLL52002.1 autotransporter [Bartonella henselae]OLL57971.1 autotransporter [Bartonella henselae]UJM43745.1 autotransporter outer membrane beta-barrel domain-containing protein [Bartonella henselae]
MKKNFLLYTVSGVLLFPYPSLSYALASTDLQPLSVSYSTEKNTDDNLKAEQLGEPVSQASESTKRKNRRRSGAEESSAGASLSIYEQPAKSKSTKAAKPKKPQPKKNKTRRVSNSDTGLQLSRMSTESEAKNAKSRKRPILESSPTNPTNEYASRSPASIKPANSAQVDEGQSTKIEVENGTTVTKQNVKIHDSYVAVHAQEANSKVKIIGGSVSSNFIGLSTLAGGTIDATNITTTVTSVGLLNTNGTIILKDSTVNVTGNDKTHGIVLRGMQNPSGNQQAQNAGREGNVHHEKDMRNKVMLTNTKILVQNGIGIGVYGAHASGEVTLKDSEIRADMLSKNEKNIEAPAHILTLNADHSILEGGVKTLADNKTFLNLNNNSTWLLTAPRKRESNNDPSHGHDIDEKLHSNLSGISLTESSIVFGTSTDGHYQTLFVGSQSQEADQTPNNPIVYKATGAAEIHLNSEWSNNSPMHKQKTDRVIINGDVSGSTIVHINFLESGNKGTKSTAVWKEEMVSTSSTAHGISLIQVSGNADKNSFKLEKGYLTMGGTPYKYVLTAYAPGTSDASQNLFGKNDQNFWDFRLQSAYVDSDKKVRALLPQVANYLVIPNAVFSAGFSEVNNQNMLLNNMRTTMFGAENHNKNGIFLSYYNEKVTLSSNRDPLHYGYGADINYDAVQLGIIMNALEGKNINTQFGLLGTYGKLSFTPKDMQDSEKTKLDKWSLTAYSGIQHSMGLYMNALLSYGVLKGNVTTALIGTAAKLDGTKTLTLSATLGQKLTTGLQGLMFEPQAQFIYQNLMLDVLSDADGLKVDMDNPHQWLVRIGGRLTKNLTTTEEDNDHAVSFYGKLNVLRTFGDGGAIQIGESFYLDPTGSSIEGGVGVNAHIAQKVVLHGDISYRHKLQKAGVSGTNFSGGIRYHF